MVKSGELKSMGRNIELTEDRVLEIMRHHNRPVWTATEMAEEAGVSRVTAAKRLEAIEGSENVATVQVGNATAYYLVGIETKPVGESTTPDTPSEDEILDIFIPCEPYTVADIQKHYEECSRWIIEDRLESLCENGYLRKKTHADKRVSFLLRE